MVLMLFNHVKPNCSGKPVNGDVDVANAIDAKVLSLYGAVSTKGLFYFISFLFYFLFLFFYFILFYFFFFFVVVVVLFFWLAVGSSQF
jgi:hypothetical protein